MTVGTLAIKILFILFCIWSGYSVKDLIKNRIENINNFTIMWFSTFIVISFVGGLVFLIFYWNYKLF